MSLLARLKQLFGGSAATPQADPSSTLTRDMASTQALSTQPAEHAADPGRPARGGRRGA